MRRFLTVLTVLGGASMAGAQTFFDNIGSFNSWAGTSSYTLRGSNLSNFQTVAQQFTSGATGTVGSVVLSVQKQVGTQTESGVVGFYADSGGFQGALIQSLAFTASPAWDSSLTLNLSGPAVSLTSGTNYWLRVTPDANSDLGWRINPNAPSGQLAAANTAAGFTYSKGIQAGMKIQAVPEPATVAIFGLGLAGLLRKRLKTSSKLA